MADETKSEDKRDPEYLAAKAKVEAEYGECAAIWTKIGGIVCRPATRDEYEKAANDQRKAGMAFTAHEMSGKGNPQRQRPVTAILTEYVNACIVYPTVEQAVRIFNRFPGAVGKLATQIDKAAGDELEVETSGN